MKQQYYLFVRDKVANGVTDGPSLRGFRDRRRRPVHLITNVDSVPPATRLTVPQMVERGTLIVTQKFSFLNQTYEREGSHLAPNEAAEITEVLDQQ